jgi:uncharacterized repeat protein (TIGR02543 family)
LYTFGFAPDDGGYSSTLVQASDGNFYGTGGNVFRLLETSYHLNLNIHDFGRNIDGHVTSSDRSINCPGTCFHQYTPGEVVTLTAKPEDTAAFTGWTGCDSVQDTVCTVTMDQDRVVTADFQPVYTVGVGKYGNGTVTSNDGHINCGDTCFYTRYLKGTHITFTATPDPGWVFNQWWGPECDSFQGNICNITVQYHQGPTAYFDPAVTLAVNKTGGGLVSSGDGLI